MKQIILWSGVGLLVAGGVLAILTFTSSSPKPGTNNTILTDIFATPVTEADHVKGNPEAALVLIEYGDFQCPACGAYFPIIQQIEAELGDQLQVVYRHFPLRQIHRNAESAARATEAAALQNKFWEMHDILFEKQSEWSGKQNPEDTFLEYARAIGLNEEQFQAALNSAAVKEKVQSDFEKGLADEVNSTPSFFLGGKKIETPRSYDEFRQLLLKALETNS